VIVCDTGPFAAVADRDDKHNRACTDLFTGLHLARRAILVPATVVAEVGYLLGRAGGAKIEAAFDAAGVAVAERLRVSEIATLDRRHLHAVRPRHTEGSSRCPDQPGVMAERPGAAGTSGSSPWCGSTGRTAAVWCGSTEPDEVQTVRRRCSATAGRICG
jgi:predicted nucleic acid-binding protein